MFHINAIVAVYNYKSLRVITEHGKAMDPDSFFFCSEKNIDEMNLKTPEMVMSACSRTSYIYFLSS